MTGFIPPKDSPLYKIMFNNGLIDNNDVSKNQQSVDEGYAINELLDKETKLQEPPVKEPPVKKPPINEYLDKETKLQEPPVKEQKVDLLLENLSTTSPLYSLLYGEVNTTSKLTSVNSSLNTVPPVPPMMSDKIDNTNVYVAPDTNVKYDNDNNKPELPNMSTGKFEMTMSYAGASQIPPSKIVDKGKPFNVVSGSPYVAPVPPPASITYSTGALPYSGSSSYYKYKFAKH